MKKIIVALLCITQMTCFGMNDGNRTVRLEYVDGRRKGDYSYLLKRSIEVQERQAKAQEFIAQSMGLLVALQNETTKDQKAKL